jgi:hypothetical protein
VVLFSEQQAFYSAVKVIGKKKTTISSVLVALVLLLAATLALHLLLELYCCCFFAKFLPKIAALLWHFRPVKSKLDLNSGCIVL